MNWLTPLTGIILASAIVPPLLLLYFLRLRRRPQSIASTMLWMRSVEDLRANAPFQRLRFTLLLLLQLLAIALLALSVAQPQIQGWRRDATRTVLLIDASASMNCADGGEGLTRLDAAKEKARERLEALYGGGLFTRDSAETMIIAFSDRADIGAKFSTSKQELLDAIDRIRPSDGQSNVGEALTLARAFTTNVDPESNRTVGDPATIELFSDGRLSDLEEQVLRGETLIYHQFGGADGENVSITTMAVERAYDRPAAVEVFASLANWSRVTTRVDVQLSVDGTSIAIHEVELPPAELDASTGDLVPGRNSLVFSPFDLERGAIIDVANLRPDLLKADDVARAVVAPPRKLSVAMVSSGGTLVRTVLQGLALRDLSLLTPDQFAAMAGSESLARFDVVVLDGWVPSAPLPAGRFLIFGPAPILAGIHPFGESGAQLVLRTRADHPIMRFVNLEQLFVGKATLIQPDEEITLLAEGSQGPLVATAARGATHVVYVAFDPLESNWPFLRSFVTFFVNAIDHLGHLGSGLTEDGLEPGDVLTARVTPGARDVNLVLPDGSIEPLTPREDDGVTWGPVREAGLYRLRWSDGADGEMEKLIPVNLLSESEGRVDARSEIMIGDQRIDSGTGAATAFVPLWPYAIGFCLVVLFLEWWLYNRRAFL